MKTGYKVFLAAASAVLSLSMSTASAETYPERPIKLVVPYAAGGASDIIARQFGKVLAQELGQPVVIENRAGAAGSIGTANVARAAADGYTLLLADTPHTINPVVLDNLPYDPITDFDTISTVGKTPLVLVARNDLPAASLQDLDEFQKTSTAGELNIGSGGTGTLTHMTGILLQQAMDWQMQHIPYNGTGPALNDVAAGHVDMMISTAPGAIPLAQGGTLKAIAITGDDRITALPEVQTFAESGIDDFNEFAWYGVLAPAGLDSKIRDQLNAATQKVLTDESLQQALAKFEVTPFPGTPSEFEAMLVQSLEKWKTIAQEHGIKE